MITEWSKFKGWTVLEYFLLHPDTATHINELSRRLGLGTYTVHRFCNLYSGEGILRKRKAGTAIQFRLNGGDARAGALKKFAGPYLAADAEHLKPFLEKNENVLSISIYGSFASGEYGDKSDLDLLVLTSDEKRLDSSDFSRLEARAGREVNVTQVSFAKWREMERKSEEFFKSVRKTHLTVWGNEP